MSGGFRREILPNRVYPRHGRNFGFTPPSLKLYSIEAYDFHENKWSYFPSMLSRRSYHSAVSIGNKMFMIGGSSDYFEVFDNVTRKFTYIKTFPEWVRTSEKFFDRRIFKPYQTVTVGHKIYFLRKEDNEVKIHSYDLKNNIFSFELLIEMEKFENFSCFKVPNV